MESRKRKSSLENYLDSLNDAPDKQRKTNEFYTGLRLFYKRKWNAPLKIPTVQGVEINLQRLYELVMAFGGWQKVSTGEKWQEVADALGVSEDVMCGEHAVKVIYMRYLYKYEQNETVGDLDDMMDGEMSRSRGRVTSSFATNECPTSHNRCNEYIKRDERGNPSTDPDYGRLIKSLLSGLPNEIDFAINVCTLLSHPGPRLLRIAHSPSILTVLVAHCAIYDEEADLSDMHQSWRETIGHAMRPFWVGSGVPANILKRLINLDIDEEAIEIDSELFTGITKVFDYRDSASWRINQIACIFRNLSFESINRVTMANSWPLMKYLILCSASKWPPLYTSALDTLSNLSFDIDLRWPKLIHESGHAILRIIHDGIFSYDKFRVIRCMEILTGLASFEGNEEIICEFLSNRLIERIFDITGIKDIMMCVYALECIYQISEMGDVTCNLLAASPRAVHQLVSMATIEAVSFGTAGLAGMKVVEYQQPLQPGQAQMQQPMMQPQVYGQSQQGNPQGMQQHHGNPPQSNMQQQQQQPPHTPNQNRAYPSVASQLLPPSSHSRVRDKSHQQLLPSNPKMVPISAHINGTVPDSEVERLTETWIKSNCQFDPGMSTPRGELYAAYVDDLRNQYHSLSGSLAMFSNVMKNIHPEVQFKLSDNGLLMVAQGIRLIRPHKLAPASSVQHQQTAAHPIMRSILTQQTTAVPNGTPNKPVVDLRTRSKTPERAPVMDNRGAKPPTVAPPSRPVVYRRPVNGVPADVHHAAAATSYVRKPVVCTVPTSKAATDYMCEWDGCGLFMNSAANVLYHVCKDHLNDAEFRDTDPPVGVCKWTNCDGTPRNKWSLVTHVQDHHTQESQLSFAAQLRRDGRMPLRPPPYRPDQPREMPPHPGYSKHAAIDAIRRHAFNFLPREITDEPEGPVTKSLRLTSCLILRNLARYSAEGRHQLRRHEPHLCWLALSRLESSHALAQLLAELNSTADDKDLLLTASASSSNLAEVPSSQSLSLLSTPLPSLPSTPQRSAKE
ncbi:hypothetical protein WR25_07294 [Diploscapter pachys]|uniref:ARID domain-containing protein n=1 Tax=Diploscapter pachys TaxID=2018661 RepID=A0A2A2JWW5_9BILA|nr:hypothetical protein WR25_07294 [Diploscapter pachys]